MGIGDWGLGIGDWGLGIGDWAVAFDKLGDFRNENVAMPPLLWRDTPTIRQDNFNLIIFAVASVKEVRENSLDCGCPSLININDVT